MHGRDRQVAAQRTVGAPIQRDDRQDHHDFDATDDREHTERHGVIMPDARHVEQGDLRRYDFRTIAVGSGLIDPASKACLVTRPPPL